MSDLLEILVSKEKKRKRNENKFRVPSHDWVISQGFLWSFEHLQDKLEKLLKKKEKEFKRLATIRKEWNACGCVGCKLQC